MRVITGQARGHRLKAPKGIDTRPTSDRVKEAIFNVLSGKTGSGMVLDVFAGTGGLGIEALSRGAAGAVFIEKNFLAYKSLKENLTRTGFSGQARVYREDFAVVLPRLKEKFRIIFLDPPYNQGLVQPAISLIEGFELLAPQGVVVLETSARQKEVPKEETIKLVKETAYGDTAVLYYTF